MNDVQIDHDDEEPDEEILTEVSTFEALMIQALVNQATSIVRGQQRVKKISYDNQLKQAQVLQSLAQTALMLTDAETIFLHGGKLQGFINRVILERTLGNKTHDRIISEPTVDGEPSNPDEKPGAEPGEGES